MVPGCLYDRAATIGDRSTGRGAQPAGDPGAARYLGDGLGERLPWTGPGVTAPAPLTPPQLADAAGDRQVPRPNGHPLLHPYRPHPAPGTPPRLLVRGGQVHHRPTLRYAGAPLAVAPGVGTAPPAGRGLNRPGSESPRLRGTHIAIRRYTAQV